MTARFILPGDEGSPVVVVRRVFSGGHPDCGGGEVCDGRFVLDTGGTGAYYGALSRPVTGDGFCMEEHRVKGSARPGSKGGEEGAVHTLIPALLMRAATAGMWTSPPWRRP